MDRSCESCGGAFETKRSSVPGRPLAFSTVDKDIEEVLRGSIGHFWEQEGQLSPDDDKALSGYVRLNDDGLVELKVLDDEDPTAGLLDHPTIAVLQT